MKIKNNVKEIVCNDCGNRFAGLIVSNQSEECWGLSADGVLTDGMGATHSLEGEVLYQTIDEIDCPCDGWSATVYFENGKVINTNDEDAVAYWMAGDCEEVKPDKYPDKSSMKCLAEMNPKELPSYR